MKIDKISLFALTLILTSTMLANIPNTIEAESPRKGPRIDDLHILFYASPEACYAALKSGDIDIMGGAIMPNDAYLDSFALRFLTPKLYIDAITDPNILLAPVVAFDMFTFDFNNNDTIATYPDVISPMNYLSFRQALAFLVDKDYIVEEICGGFAERIDVPLPYPQKSWWNESITGVNYPYPYDPETTEAIMDASGFIQGTTPNPYYDPAFPGSAEFIRVYPLDHPQKPSQDLDPLVCCIRSDDLRMLHAGRLLLDNLRKHGVPCNPTEGDVGVLYDKVMGKRDYHIYTGSWSLGRYPIYLYELFHSSRWFPQGSNYVTPDDSALDTALEGIRYASTIDEAMISTKLSQGILVNNALSVWLWSYKGFQAYRNLCGLVNMQGYGIDNKYTWLNAYRSDDSAQPIRIGTGMPFQLNQIYSSLVYDWQNLERFVDIFANVNPYDIVTKQPWVTRDLEAGEWIDPEDGKTKLKVTYWLREDSSWINPESGAMLKPLTTDEYEFTSWYYFQEPRGWVFDDYKDIKYIRPITDYEVEVYYDIYPWWPACGAHCRTCPPKGLPKALLSTLETRVFVEGINATTPGYLDLPFQTLGAPVEIISISEDGITLAPYTDYEIVKGRVRIYKDIVNGKLIAVEYWARDDPAGYTPGELPWNEVLIGTGPWYMTSFDPIVGATFRANSHFFLDTPPLGEIYWHWNWIEGSKPRNGCYKIDIYDIVMAAGAYGSQGTGIPDPKWFAGADVAPLDGKIDIFDIVTIVGKYGQEWGYPP